MFKEKPLKKERKRRNVEHEQTFPQVECQICLFKLLYKAKMSLSVNHSILPSSSCLLLTIKKKRKKKKEF